MMRFSVFLAIGGLFTACTSQPLPSDDAAVLTTNGFEQSIGWGDAPTTSLTNEKAHTGRWSIRVKPDVPFSYTYARTLGELKSSSSRKLVLSAWALRLAAGSTAKLVVQVDSSASDERKVFYDALPLDKAVPTFGNWTAVNMPLTLPASVKEVNKLRIYLWNDQGTAPTYLDDVTLRTNE